MYPIRNYLQTARDNELVFRSILKDLKVNHNQRPGGAYIPEDFETEASLESIFQKYSCGHRYGIFTITDFTVTGEVALIEFEDVACLSGGGARLRYLIKDNGVEYSEPECVFLC